MAILLIAAAYLVLLGVGLAVGHWIGWRRPPRGGWPLTGDMPPQPDSSPTRERVF